MAITIAPTNVQTITMISGSSIVDIFQIYLLNSLL